MRDPLQTYIFTKKIYLTFLALVFLFTGISQCPSGEQVEKKISRIIKSPSLSGGKKLQLFYDFKKEADDCNIARDSVYAWLLSRIGLYEYNLNKNYGSCIELTLESVRINSLARDKGSKIGKINDYINLGYYYRDIFQYSRSLSCCDSAIAIAGKFRDTYNNAIVEAKIIKTNVYFYSGDYQKCIEESTKGIEYTLNKKDTINYVEFLIQRIQSLFYQNKLKETF